MPLRWQTTLKMEYAGNRDVLIREPNPDCIVISLEDYPDKSVAHALCALSLDGKAFQYPNDLNKKSNWKWQFLQQHFASVCQILEKSGVYYTREG